MAQTIYRSRFGGAVHLLRGTSPITQDGTVKLLTIDKSGEVHEKVILSEPHPIVRLAQSMTGNVIVASVQDKNRSVVLH